MSTVKVCSVIVEVVSVTIEEVVTRAVEGFEIEVNRVVVLVP